MDWWDWVLLGVSGGFLAGFEIGHRVEAWHWRSVGLHEYMNRKESGGRLYRVVLDEKAADHARP